MTSPDIFFFFVELNMVLFIPIWIPVIVLCLVARNRNRSLAYGWWGAMSFFGMIIGLILLIARDPLPPGSNTGTF